MTIIGYLILKLTRVGIHIERDELCAAISHNWDKAKLEISRILSQNEFFSPKFCAPLRPS